MSEFKHPNKENREYCEKGSHTFIARSDGRVSCYFCGKELKRGYA